MSQPPPLKAPAVPPVHGEADFVRPLALGCMLASALLAAWFVVQALVAIPVSATPQWQAVQDGARAFGLRPSAQWLLAHPVLASALLAASCLPGLAICIGLYRRQAWGLWGFAAWLVLTGLGNFVVAWWMDGVIMELIAGVTDAAMRDELLTERFGFSVTLLGTCVLFGALQGWLAWRLLQADIRARF